MSSCRWPSSISWRKVRFSSTMVGREAVGVICSLLMTNYASPTTCIVCPQPCSFPEHVMFRGSLLLCCSLTSSFTFASFLRVQLYILFWKYRFIVLQRKIVMLWNYLWRGCAMDLPLFQGIFALYNFLSVSLCIIVVWKIQWRLKISNMVFFTLYSFLKNALFKKL